MPIAYRFRPIPFIATLAVMVIAVLLGQWQTRRAAEKDRIEMALTVRAAEPAIILSAAHVEQDIEYRKVLVTGRFATTWPVYLDNRPYKGKAGLYVLMPFQIGSSDKYVLVAHGWQPRNATDRSRVMPDATPKGEVQIEGIAKRSSGQVMQLGKPEKLQPGAIVQNVDLAGFSYASKMNLQPFILEQTSDTHDGLIRDWPSPSLGSDKHRGYAFQWYALALMAFSFFVVTGLRRGKQAN